MKTRVTSAEQRGLSSKATRQVGQEWRVTRVYHLRKSSGNYKERCMPKRRDYRFYSLYDKLYRPDVLAEAWRRCRANAGTAGVDGVSFASIEAQGVNGWLGQLAQSLKDKSYKPDAVRRVWIPKPNGKQRPLGIPTIRDRVVQMAAVLLLEPIFEADLPDEQYAYRAKRSAHGAIDQVHRWLQRGLREVIDADLSGYFDTIPHTELMKSLARRISDGALLALLKQWLQMPVEQSDGRGGRRRSNPARRRGRGTPQERPSRPFWPTSTCVVSFWGGNTSAMNDACKHTLSITLTISSLFAAGKREKPTR